MNAAASCNCGWSFVVSEAEAGQTLFGTLGWHMARHASLTGHDQGLSIDWGQTG